VIVGDGMIASAFKVRAVNLSGFTLFASGVSDSNEVNPENFTREENALKLHLSRCNNIIYFSTCSILDPELRESAYVLHKLAMESYICKESKNYLIFRLPQVVGFSRNKNTLVNFLFEKVSESQSINVWTKATRNLIDIDDIVSVVEYILEHKVYINDVINVANPYSVYISEIVSIFEKILNKRAFITSQNRGGNYKIDTSSVNRIYADLGINFNQKYTEKILKKYYLK
jgi:nucleoside-diphosphate-sugar epimerase